MARAASFRRRASDVERETSDLRLQTVPAQSASLAYNPAGKLMEGL